MRLKGGIVIRPGQAPTMLVLGVASRVIMLMLSIIILITTYFISMSKTSFGNYFLNLSNIYQ